LEISIEKWFSANLCSTLGGVLDLLKEVAITIHFGHVNQRTETIFRKNDFFSHFSYNRMQDTYDTTIRYLKLKPSDGRYFFEYITKNLLNRAELPLLSSGLKNKISESINEIFTNAQIHSESNHIYTCGQYFPHKHTIEFTISDVGIGIQERVNRRFNSNLTSIQAIKWATIDTHTTKRDRSGGIGLALLKEFIMQNKGKFQIVSNDGFYNLDSIGETFKHFNGGFPGTVINMQFRTDDSSSYCLTEEVDFSELF
jgi:hypothetical protein